jgi:LacI family ebg operon transcriptional repressor
VEENPQISLKEDILCDGFGSIAGYDALKSYIQAGKSIPQAIFTGTDSLAIGVLKAMHEFHKPIQNIISINGDSSGAWAHPQLTSVDINARLMEWKQSP